MQSLPKLTRKGNNAVIDSQKSDSPYLLNIATKPMQHNSLSQSRNGSTGIQIVMSHVVGGGARNSHHALNNTTLLASPEFGSSAARLRSECRQSQEGSPENSLPPYEPQALIKKGSKIIIVDHSNRNPSQMRAHNPTT